MLFRRFLLSGLVVPVAAALSLKSAGAQVMWSPAPSVPRTAAGPVAIEGYYSHYRLDADSDERFAMNGVGARLMWNPASLDTSSFASRVGLGLFGEYAPGDGSGFSLLHVGLQGDATLVSEPWFGRMTPIASLGAGILHTDVDDVPKAASTRFPPGMRSSTSFALAPAAGLQLGLWRELGARATVRDLVTFRGDTRHNVQYTLGLTLPF